MQSAECNTGLDRVLQRAMILPSWLYRVRAVHRLLPTAFCFLLSAYWLAPSVVYGQGCAMCYTSASAAQEGAKQALAKSTLILLAPPMLFFVLIGVVLYLYRNKFRDVYVVRGPLSVDAPPGNWGEPTPGPRGALWTGAARRRFSVGTEQRGSSHTSPWAPKRRRAAAVPRFAASGVRASTVLQRRLPLDKERQ